jgi:hypothetical protein
MPTTLSRKAGGDEVDSDGRELLHTHAAQPRSVIRSAFSQEKPFGAPSISRDGAHLVYTEVETPPIKSLYANWTN